MKKITKLISSLLLLLAFSSSTKAQWTESLSDFLYDPVSMLSGQAANGKAIFRGGMTASSQYWSDLNEYTALTDSWSYYPQGNGRKRMGSTTLGNNLFFGGGSKSALSYDEVNIYNTITGTWSTSYLSQARDWLAAAGAGSKVLFGGGYDNNIAYSLVDIYDTLSQTWTTANLSQARYDLCAAACGNYILFAGGAYGDWEGDSLRYNTVDIWDITANSGTGGWITRPEDTLSVARSGCSAVALGTKIYIAGGTTGRNLFSPTVIDEVMPSDVVDIYDVVTKQWTTTTLCIARTGIAGAATGDVLIFAGGSNRENGSSTTVKVYDSVDVYDRVSDTWSVQHLNIGRTLGAAVAVNNTTFIVAGGKVNHIIPTDKIETMVVPAPTIPVTPTGFLVTDTTMTTATVEWTADPNAINYEVYYKTSAGTNWDTITVSGSVAITATMTGLTANTDYVTKMSACNSVGCSTPTADVPFKTLSVANGIAELNKELQFSVFPNPATNSIELKVADIKEKGSVKIINSLGQVVYSNSIQPNTLNVYVNIDMLAKGLYSVELYTNNARTTRKFIKE